MKGTLVLWITAVGISLSACGPTNIEDGKFELIPEDPYVNLIIEFQLLRSGGNLTRDTLGHAQKRHDIVARYGYTLPQFEASHRHYQRTPAKFKALMDMAVDRLKSEADRLQPREQPDSSSTSSGTGR